MEDYRYTAATAVIDNKIVFWIYDDLKDERIFEVSMDSNEAKPVNAIGGTFTSHSTPDIHLKAGDEVYDGPANLLLKM